MKAVYSNKKYGNKKWLRASDWHRMSQWQHKVIAHNLTHLSYIIYNYTHTCDSVWHNYIHTLHTLNTYIHVVVAYEICLHMFMLDYTCIQQCLTQMCKWHITTYIQSCRQKYTHSIVYHKVTHMYIQQCIYYIHTAYTKQH